MYYNKGNLSYHCLPEKYHIKDTIETNRDELLKYFELLSIMRRFEIECDQLYKSKKIHGFCHLYDGQEAVALGIEEAITHKDSIITAYRQHCQAYLRGISMKQMFLEMCGKEGGCSEGKGGSMHFYKNSTRYFGGNGIVGAQIPVGTGLAFAHKYLGENNVSVVLYGDGAANQGQLFESVNMAKIWNLPVIFVCENNHYAMGTSVSRGAYMNEFHERFPKIAGIKCDGLQVFNVRETFKKAKEYALENGPIIINAETYRYHGHSMSDPGVTYRNKEEVSGFRKDRDCIKLVKDLMIDNNLATESELKAIEKRIRADISKTTEEVLAAPDVKLDHLLTNIYDKEEFFKRSINYEDSIFIKEKHVM